MPDGHSSLAVPLFSSLRAVAFGEHGNPHHFQLNVLFWSLTRLFGHYERILAALEVPYEDRYFIASDIESFLVRFRVVLNDIAFVTWQMLPDDERELKGPKGNTHPRNKEMSFVSLATFLGKNATRFPELASAYANALPWATRLKDGRDNILHYKTQVHAFDSEVPSFGFINAAGTQRMEVTPEGGERLLLIPTMKFVNDELFALHNFMHCELAPAIEAHASRIGLGIKAIGGVERMSCVGIARFMRLNGLT